MRGSITSNMAKIGLALSGGGSRCFAQLGAMAYFEEKGIKVSAISGSSAGSIIAGLYASGMSVEDIYLKLKEIDYKSHLRYNIKNGSLYHLKEAIYNFQQIFGVKDIEDFKIPYYCCVTNYENGEVEYLNRGEMVTLMTASCSLVPLFAPIEYGDKIYIDGGYCDNLPTKPLAQICDHIIGINVNPISNYINYSFKSHLARSMFIMLNHNIKFGKKECDLFIEIKEMGRYSIFDLKNFELFFDFGYNEAKKYDSEIERLL